MKTTHIIIAMLFGIGIARAQIIVPGANGTDGGLNITANTVIDLSQAVTGVWDQDNSANAGKGVYDPDKWAVVFKYTNVTVNAGATVTFKNHPSRAPVVWLVSGDVTINGVVSLNGSDWSNSVNLSEPGPGGFRGGADVNSPVDYGSGFGMGGGYRSSQSGGGSYGTSGRNSSGGTYGNPSCIPLIGGSGSAGAKGGGNGDYVEQGGAGGGGAILIACASTVSISVTGQIYARGGNGSSSFWGYGPGGGAGGAVRLVCNELAGGGVISATGGNPGGGNGRIRIERATNNNLSIPLPAPSVVDLAPGSTALLWPPSGSPEVKVLSIGGETAPDDPRAAFGTFGADVALPLVGTTQVIVETKNVEPESAVTVRITPRDTFNAQVITAARIDPPVSTDPLTYHWSANVPTNLGYSAIQVKVVRP